MIQKVNIRCEELAKIIKSLAHPSHLMIVEELNDGNRYVSELTELVGFDASTVLKHLNILKNAGLVRTEKQGIMIYYILRMPCLMESLRCLESVMEANALGHLETMISCMRK